LGNGFRILPMGQVVARPAVAIPLAQQDTANRRDAGGQSSPLSEQGHQIRQSPHVERAIVGAGSGGEGIAEPPTIVRPETWWPPGTRPIRQSATALSQKSRPPDRNPAGGGAKQAGDGGDPLPIGEAQHGIGTPPHPRIGIGADEPGKVVTSRNKRAVHDGTSTRLPASFRPRLLSFRLAAAHAPDTMAGANGLCDKLGATFVARPGK
jgi:hypothetical protein